MESFFSRFKNALVLIALLLAQTIALATQIRRPVDASLPDGARVRLVRMWALALISPFERVSSMGGHGLRSAWSNYIALRHVRQQNGDLQRQIAQLRVERAALAEDALEGHRLAALLAFREHYIQKTVLAQVVGTSGTDQSRLLTLDKGARDGLKAGMPVITPDGVVGKLRDVFPETSQLLLLDDATAGAGVMLESTRIRAIVRGTPDGRLQIGNLTADDRIKPGEHVLTSGGDQVFPRGLPVGTVESIAPDPEHQPYTAIRLRPAANLNQLEEVLVVTGTGAGLDPATQKELADDVAARAEDIGAERLPSLHDGAPAEPAPPGAAVPGNGAPGNAAPGAAAPGPAGAGLAAANASLPRPKPVLHPDKYTPGAAPPASDLTPGAPKD